MPQHEKEALLVDADPSLYTYESLEHDVGALARNYPQWVRLDSLGLTADGRNLHHLVIGAPDAERHVLIHAGIHAREYITVQLVMKQASSFLSHAESGDSYGNARYDNMLNSVAIHVVPCVNPDGMALSQTGLDAIQSESIRSQLSNIAAHEGYEPSNDYFRNWKANANGVDLNRNFDALWEDFGGAIHPASERFKGIAPNCEIESSALVALTEHFKFVKTISYHAMGSVIYWYFGQEGALLDKTQAFAQSMANVTGYRLDANYEYLDPAGYKDWAIRSMDIPSLTIEVGWGETPVPSNQFQTIWRENEYVWEEMVI